MFFLGEQIAYVSDGWTPLHANAKRCVSGSFEQDTFVGPCF